MLKRNRFRLCLTGNVPDRAGLTDCKQKARYPIGWDALRRLNLQVSNRGDIRREALGVGEWAHSLWLVGALSAVQNHGGGCPSRIL
jgi:hypothetical protein